MVMPNFLIIGAPKAGTTSLYYYLRQHPDIYLSPLKEPHFFGFEGETLRFMTPGNQSAELNATAVTNLEQYQRLFEGVTTERAIGEASPSYLQVPRAAVRIKHYLPQVKLIAILRHPVERAYSAFLHQYVGNVDRGTPALLDFAQALRDEDQFIRDNWMPLYHFRTGGYYYQQLKQYYELFDRQQLRIYLHEDLRRQPIDTLQDIFRFLEVDDTFVPDVSVNANVSGIPKNKLLFQLFRNRAVKALLRPLFPKGFGQQIEKMILAKPKLEPQVRQDLMMAYHDEILKLQDLIQRDLSGWLA